MSVTSVIKERLPYRVRRALAISKMSARSLASRHKGYKDFVLSTISASQRMDRSFGRPVHVSIEPTNICNLRCPVCETGDGTLGRKSGHLPVEGFKHIVDTLSDHVNVLYYYFMGEPFLVKNAYDMIAYATEKQIWVDTCTNGEFVDAKSLIDSGIGRISFQIGGMTQKTHETYRVRGNLDAALANLEACVAEKRRRPDSRSQIKVGFIVMKHNEHEVDAFTKYAKEIGVDDYEIVYPGVRTLEQGHEYLTMNEKYWVYDKDAFDRGILKPKLQSNHYCEWLYYTTTIQVNGDVVPCCRDPRGQNVLGNVFEQDFVSDIWNGEAYRNFRRLVATNQGDTGICSMCEGYTAPDITKHDEPLLPIAGPEPIQQPEKIAS